MISVNQLGHLPIPHYNNGTRLLVSFVLSTKENPLILYEYIPRLQRCGGRYIWKEGTRRYSGGDGVGSVLMGAILLRQMLIRYIVKTPDGLTDSEI